MEFESINPYNGAVVGTYTSLSETELNQKLDNAHTAFLSWRKVPLTERCTLMQKAGQVLRDNAADYARMISLEMGKPIKEAIGEVNKCAWVCDYYTENAATFLADEIIKTEAQKSFVRHEPIGAVFAVMPWNFPFWQVFRFAAPTLTAGNVGLLKHAANVFGCVEMIEDVFSKAGFPKTFFKT